MDEELKGADIHNSVLIQNLAFSYPNNGKKIFTDVNIEVQEGEFCCLLGQSGCGKSTLLRLIAGLEKPSAGTVSFPKKMYKKPSLDLAVVFQDYGLYPWLSTGKNIELAIEQKYPEMSKKERKELARLWIRKVNLSEEVYKMLPKQLSGGMRQRCAIARTFAIDAPIMLMDEPFGALDAVTRVTLQDMLLELCKTTSPKKTVFFVTHDVDEALLLAERIFVIGQGSSDVIYETYVEDNQRLKRGHESNEATIKLRNELIYQINKDVQSMINEGR